MEPQEINERLCKLMYKVWTHIDPNATTANDCHCNRGGLWKSPNYGPESFRSDGKALEFVEKAVEDKLATMAGRKRPWKRDIGKDFDNWFDWMWNQPGGSVVLADASGDHDESLYAIMCDLLEASGQ